MAKTNNKAARHTQAGSLHGELASLFGQNVLTRALTCDVAELDFLPDEIALASRELRQLSGQPAAQVMMARRLPDDVQAALCMWLVSDGMKVRLLKSKGASLQ